MKKDGYWGVINEVGQVVIPFRYSGITAEKDGKDDFDWKNIAYDVTLEEFGRKGWGMLLKDGEIKGESGADFFFINDDDIPETEKTYKCDTFVQTIPCEYEDVSVMRDYREIEGIQVEKMGRVAVYNTDGRLQENFKLKETL